MVWAILKCNRRATVIIVTLIIITDKGDIGGNVGYSIKNNFNDETYLNLLSSLGCHIYCVRFHCRSLVGLVATKSHACYLLGGTG